MPNLDKLLLAPAPSIVVSTAALSRGRVAGIHRRPCENMLQFGNDVLGRRPAGFPYGKNTVHASELK